MVVQNFVVYQTWVIRITLATTLLVVVLSWINAVKISDIFIRAGVSYGVMYFLMAGSLHLFEWAAPPEPEDEQPNLDSEQGGLIDISIGDDELQPQQVQDTDPNFPGQVDPSLSTGLPGSKQQAEIVRRMGWE